ncbi:Beta-lactamase domain-containing protein 2-like protein 1 [Phlyctema vagabunda]|uniref:Beta-lactamase domain-containing protein 2-like protein 1 n=1 Tax=Phlyctema vagabunda TaxID=108571 RepID=A0ABR4P4M7_9HELO
MSDVQGYCDESFEEVRHLFQTYIDSGEELGASLYVTINGTPVVDIYGGYKDETLTELWREDTIANVFSTSKAICALAALTLVDRGMIDVNAKVSKYWPEFAQNGKEKIEVRHILSHTSGVSGWESPMSKMDMYNFEESVQKLAEQKPWWEAGTASGYHSLTFGFLIGELVRRVTGKTLKGFIADELATPASADFQLGVRDNDIRRTSHIVPYLTTPSAMSSSEPDSTSIAFKSFSNPQVKVEMANTPAWREAEIGAANGHANARGVGRILSAIALSGNVDGTQVLSRETIDLIF